MGNSSGATVIFLQSHPLWVAAQRRAQERSEVMRRHPSSRLGTRHLASIDGVTPPVRNFTILSSNDTPA